MKNKIENKNLVYALLLGGAIIVGVFAVRQKTNSLPNVQTASQPAQQIQNDNELSQVSNELDKETIESLDEGLSQNDSDASSF